MASTMSSEPTVMGQVWALLVKRAIYMWRQMKMPLFSWIMPQTLLALLFFLEFVSLRGSGRAVEHVGPTLQYKFPEVVDKPQSIHTSVDVTESLLSSAKESLYAYVFNAHFGIQMTQEAGNVLWYNGQIQHMAPLVTRLYNTARLRNITNVATAEFTFDVTSRGIEEEREAVEHASRESESIRSQNTYRTLVPKILRSIFFPLVSSLMCSNFVLFPISERALQASVS
ncbi:hypothetical protein V5799_030769 [Amblyomma americanum]|uniref:Uncharacterized protein n=1 Tax=Amblyomma americanum TaxID=6943 RepID=A0AAQ4EM45_AMBAM